VEKQHPILHRMHQQLLTVQV